MEKGLKENPQLQSKHDCRHKVRNTFTVILQATQLKERFDDDDYIKVFRVNQKLLDYYKIEIVSS